MKELVLSTKGGDRATAYVMSNKIVPLPEGYLVTWIDCERQNRWAIVDLAICRISQSGPLGDPCIDNHCGAALVLAGTHVHAVTGGHHSALQHYRMALSEPGEWHHVAGIEGEGTYPSVSPDSRGRLHLAFRKRGNPWSLDYCRFEDDAWTSPQALVLAEKPGYIYWTNGLTVGNDDALHLVFGNTRVEADGTLLYGASHIASSDGGHTWRDDKDRVLPIPSPVSALPLIVDEGRAARVPPRSDQHAQSQRGARSLNYQQINLSNPVVDQRGVVHVVFHNGMAGTADLMSRSAGGLWTATPLTASATQGDPRSRVHVQSSLCLREDGHLCAALMVEQTEENVWGAPGTKIVLVEVGVDGDVIGVDPVPGADADLALWLPALPGQTTVQPRRPVPLLYTRGVNAGGFENNKNSVETDVVLCGF